MTRLIADIGGTNARFARADAQGNIAAEAVLRVADFESFEAALSAYRARDAASGPFSEAAIAAAGPVDGGVVELTNAAWRIHAGEVAQMIGGGPVAVFNDLQAVALSLPHLEAGDRVHLGGPQAGPGEGAPCDRLVAINVGTGFGAALTMRTDSGAWIACPGEPGHGLLAAGSPDEWRVLQGLKTTPASIEDVLSGAGLVGLYRALCRDVGVEPPLQQAEDVFAAAGDDPQAAMALHLFTVWLGRTAASVVLASAAWGGAYLVGGLLDGWRHVADIELFARSFVGDGKMRGRLGAMPVHVVTRDRVALLGLAKAPL